MRKQNKMGLFDKIKKAFTKPEPEKVVKEPKPKKEPELSAKDKATKEGEPYVNVLSMEIDPEDIHNGAFELDFNEIFVARLVKSGYMMKPDDTDAMIVDRWFQDVCRNIALEMYEQVQADPANRDLRNIRQRNLGNGRTEVS